MFIGRTIFFSKDLSAGGQVMEGVLFLVFWLGGAALHTLYDLKVKPVVRALREESDIS
jgi:hypothetical protein